MDQIIRAFTVIGLLAVMCGWAVGQTSAITYQGELKQSGAAAQGTYEMEFRLFDSFSGGAQIGSPITNNSVSVTDGIFSVILNFGTAAFASGADRFLSISVHKVGDPPGLTLLSPRQPITSSPYSLKTVSAVAADSLSPACVGCVADGNINSVSGAKVTGTVANATNASTAANVSGIVPITSGGTGSATKNFVDLSTDQFAIGGNKLFTGNVSVGGTFAATLGQSASTVYSTSGIVAADFFAVVPGLTRTINVPIGYSAFVSSNGGIQTSVATTNGVTRLDIAFYIDGAVVPSGNFQRVIVANTTGAVNNISYWGLSSVAALTPGSHTIDVRAFLQSGSPATVGGNSSSVLQGDLTVIFIKN